MNITHVIIKPVLTEKASSMAGKNVYTFLVHNDANKNQIAKVLEGQYKVKIGQVRISNRKGKTKRFGKKMQEKQMPDLKIAYVYVTEGKIDVFPQS